MKENGDGGVGHAASTHAFSHHAMNTWWQVRVSGEEETYVAQAAQAAFAITDRLESLMSRFRDDSEIACIAKLPAGGRQRVSRDVFDCLSLALEIQGATNGAFDIAASIGTSNVPGPGWSLDEQALEVVIGATPRRMDLGAIAKGFALDRMSEELEVWGLHRFLLMSSGSSILAGDSPVGSEGWAVRLGENGEMGEVSLTRKALGTSGFSMRGAHILNPSTGIPSSRYERSWAIAATAAEADALSTSWMNMEWDSIVRCCESRNAGACVLDPVEGAREAGLSGLLKRNTA
jgi:thiamine biosynthesis lipoprotein